MSEFNEYQDVARDDEEAEPDSEQKLGAWVDPPLDLCPVLPLGRLGERIYWAMPEGDIRHAPSSKIGPMLKTDIFASEAGAVFLNYWRDREGKFQQQSAAIWFVRACRKAGFWDVGRPIRGLGVWPAAGGVVVLHKGDELLRYEPGGVKTISVLEALKEGGKGPLYELKPSAPAPAPPAKAKDGQEVRGTLDFWRFKPIGDDGLTGADVVAGWIMPSLLGAVAPFRTNLMIDASAGAGKTTLMELLQAALSALAGEVVDDFSDAGLRNDLAGMARPVLLDEGETSTGGQGPGPVERALDLVRRMTTGKGGTRKMGTIGGAAVTQTAVGCVALAGINPPKLGPADVTRWVEVRLLPLGGAAEAPEPPCKASDADLRAAIERARVLAPALLGRALANAGRYLADVGLIKAAMVSRGELPRTGDMIAMLAAGRRLLLFDKPLTPETALEELTFWQPLLNQREAAGAVSNAGQDAFAHLLSFRSDQHRQDRYLTLGELVHRVTQGDREYLEVLKAYGLRMFDADRAWWLLVANEHPTLRDKIFRGTPWSDWRRALSYLDDLGEAYATRPAKKQRYGLGVEQRGLAIPLTPWLEDRSASVPGPFRGYRDDW